MTRPTDHFPLSPLYAGGRYREGRSSPFINSSILLLSLALAHPTLAQTSTSPSTRPTASLAELLADDRALLIDLSLNHLTTLQNHLMDQMNLTPAQRQAVQAIDLTKLLASPDSISKNLVIVQDPAQLIEITRLLSEKSARNSDNLLQYWPANPRVQASALPLANALDQLYLRAIDLAKDRSKLIENAITPENQDALGVAWERQQNLIALASYRRAFNLLTLALCMDKASPKRSDSLTTAADLLAPFLDEKFNVQNPARIAIGKMRLFNGDPKAASTLFKQVIDDPKASQENLFEAHYFSLVADAASDPKTLNQWIQSNFAAGSEQHKSMLAAMAILDYRRACDKADAAPPDARQSLNLNAISLLDRLAEDRPDLRPVIQDQTLARLPDKPDLSKLSPRLLIAVATRAADESNRERPTASILEQGADACEKLLASNLSDDNRALALLIKAQLCFKQGKPQPAIDSLLDFLDQFPADSRAASAIESAAGLFAQNISDSSKLRFFKIATSPPFSKNIYCLSYAQLLLKLNIADFATDHSAKRDAMIQNANLAIALCAQCPPADAPRAKFNELIARDQLVDLLPENQIPAQLEKALALSDQILANKPADAESKLIAAKTVLIRAGLAIHLPPDSRDKAMEANLQKLKEIQTLVVGLPEAAAINTEASLARINHLIALNRADEALEDLEKVLASGGRGLSEFLSTLNALNAAYQSAVTENNVAKIKTLSLQRAYASNLLLQFSEKSTAIPLKDLQQYREFAAEAALAASPHEPDLKKKSPLLASAIRIYESKIKESPNDPKWPLKLAFARFELQQYDQASPILSKLIADKSLGAPPNLLRQRNPLLERRLLGSHPQTPPVRTPTHPRQNPRPRPHRNQRLPQPPLRPLDPPRRR